MFEPWQGGTGLELPLVRAGGVDVKVEAFTQKLGVEVDGCKLPKRFEPKLSHTERIVEADSFFARVGVATMRPCQPFREADSPAPEQ